MIEAILLAASGAVALFIQHTALSIAASWWILFTAACALLTFRGRHSLPFRPVPVLLLLWLFWILLSGFFLSPVYGGATFMSVLTAPPLLCLALLRDDGPDRLREITILCLAALALFAGFLIYQRIFWPKEAFFYGRRAGWPLINPNNAASLINTGLIPCLCLALRDKKKVMIFLSALFAAALLATESRGGCISAAVAMTVYMVCMFPRFRAPSVAALAAFVAWVLSNPHSLGSMLDRLPIWEGASRLLFLKPFSGLGIGTFPHYYEQVRIENCIIENGVVVQACSMGSFAHNDILQFAIEMGVPAAMIFCLLAGTIALHTTKKTLIPAVSMLAVLTHSFFSFPFYIAPVSIGIGILMSWWLLLGRDCSKIRFQGS